MNDAPSLSELQQQFLAALYDDNASGPVAAVAGNGLDPEARLRIYRHSCNEVQTGALRTTYPGVLALVGEAWFDQAACNYRRSHPSSSGNLQVFGDVFAEYLDSLPERRTLAYLPDVARLEWLRQQSALAPASQSIAAETFAESLQRVGQPLRLAMHPSVQLLASPYAVLTIWRFAMAPTPEGLTLGDEGENVVLWREDGEVAMAALDPASFACITALAQGRLLREADTAGVATDPDFDFPACLQSLLERDLISGIRPFAPRHAEPSMCR